AELPTAALALRHARLSAEELARRLRLGRVRIVGRIQQDRVLIDLRSVVPEDDGRMIEALRDM
ncbi:MAG: L-seryl-tRNA(Sec) selenium transferase, partial [Planctomycetaceae bacterium]